MTSSSSGETSTSPQPKRPLRRKPMPRKGHTKSRRGCLNCKRRRVKCPETLPSCETCYRLGLSCEYPASIKGTEVGSVRQTLQTSPAQLSITDLRFFHHFLLHAYPGLPIGGEAVWREVAKLSHTYDFLAHAVLALGASHLNLCKYGHGDDFDAIAISHRVKAINSINVALDTPCRSIEDMDARFAALMALTFQSSYMPDGMQEFISMMRGCNIVQETNKLFGERSSVFADFSSEVHVDKVMELHQGRSSDSPNHHLWESGICSLALLEQHCRGVGELRLLEALRTILRLAATSSIDAFSELCRSYDMLSDSTHPDFRGFADVTNHPAQIILAHFFVIEYALAMVALDPVFPSFPFRRNIVSAWVSRVYTRVPKALQPLVDWPRTFILELRDDWGGGECRRGLLGV